MHEFMCIGIVNKKLMDLKKGLPEMNICNKVTNNSAKRSGVVNTSIKWMISDNLVYNL